MRYSLQLAESRFRGGVTVYAYLWPLDTLHPSPEGMTLASDESRGEALERIRRNLAPYAANIMAESPIERVSHLIGRNFSYGYEFRSQKHA